MTISGLQTVNNVGKELPRVLDYRLPPKDTNGARVAQ